ncbi:MAG: AAA family ATPase [Actinobacteria bacterium]|nr:AAA family ATPase [Actinomycetota bacterium]
MSTNAITGEQVDRIDGQPAPGSAGLVRRDRLLRRLREDPSRTLVLCAPSGYGKSVLLEQLAAADDRHVAAVLLAARHNDPIVLVESIAAALGGPAEFPADVADALKAPRPDLERVVLPRLAATMEARRRPCLLMLDELERIESPGSLAIIGALARGMPAGSQLALASRVEPPLRLGRLRAMRRLTELRREDLTMTRSECGALLAAIDLDLSPRRLDAIVARTEGWPAALYLAGLALGGASDLSRAIARFAGDDRVVIDYMREEFLLPVSRTHLAFLRRASVLERLSGSLCDATLGRRDSAAVLRELSGSNILLIPLDRRDHWYRFHPLLQDMLRAELRASEPEAERDLHLRASEWWREQGDWDHAIHHAVEAEAPARAGELLWTAFPEYATRGRNATVVGWLERLGEAKVAASPGLSLAAAWAQLTLGQGPRAEYWAAVTARLLDEGGGPEEAGPRISLAAGLALVGDVLCRSGLVPMRESVAAVESLLAEEDPWRTLCCLLDGIGLHLLGERPAARRRLREGVRRGSVGAPNLQVVCLAQLTFLSLEEEDLDQAAGEAARARAQIDRYGLGEYPMAALPFAASALARARGGQVDAAAADLATAERLFGELDHFSPWYGVETRLALAHASSRLGARAEARRFAAAAARELAELPGGSATLRRWLEQTEEALGGEEIPAPAERLTAAELRILQFLPSHRSVPQVAADVHLSPNTVKTHVRSIYRKFGVSSRQDAVEFARRAGLLGEEA